MLGFQPRISGFGSDHLTTRATITELNVPICGETKFRTTLSRRTKTEVKVRVGWVRLA